MVSGKVPSAEELAADERGQRFPSEWLDRYLVACRGHGMAPTERAYWTCVRFMMQETTKRVLHADFFRNPRSDTIAPSRSPWRR